MSITTVPPQAINSSPLNHSKSKQMYSFSKAPRLMENTKNQSPAVFYDLPPLKEVRSTGFGYGKRSDFTKPINHNPGPESYSLRSESHSPTKKGFSFGVGREQVAASGNFMPVKESPGPAAYDTRETNKHGLAYSMRGRTKSTDHNLKHAEIVPGPGAYPVYETINSKGIHHVAKYKNTSSVVFPPINGAKQTSPREVQKPGPGAYNTVCDLNSSGAYYVSTYHSSPGKSFGLALKKDNSSVTQFKKQIPGPGAYEATTEFGNYKPPAELKQQSNLSSSIEHIQ